MVTAELGQLPLDTIARGRLVRGETLSTGSTRTVIWRFHQLAFIQVDAQSIQCRQMRSIAGIALDHRERGSQEPDL